ncbi:hypothetical protein ACEWY4_017532 [Coilia grayii]|uniref:Uncharacterized protein n=1 Tax=Coilia grayii TaxID=363190 RepID=A0ABD1JH54_9TELE
METPIASVKVEDINEEDYGYLRLWNGAEEKVSSFSLDCKTESASPRRPASPFPVCNEALPIIEVKVLKEEDIKEEECVYEVLCKDDEEVEVSAGTASLIQSLSPRPANSEVAETTLEKVDWQDGGGCSIKNGDICVTPSSTPQRVGIRPPTKPSRQSTAMKRSAGPHTNSVVLWLPLSSCLHYTLVALLSSSQAAGGAAQLDWLALLANGLASVSASSRGRCDVGCQTDPPQTHTVGTQLSMKTLQPHFRSRAVQTIEEAPLTAPLPFILTTPLKSGAKTPRLEEDDDEEEEDEEGPKRPRREEEEEGEEEDNKEEEDPTPLKRGAKAPRLEEEEGPTRPHREEEEEGEEEGPKRPRLEGEEQEEEEEETSS